MSYVSYRGDPFRHGTPLETRSSSIALSKMSCKIQEYVQAQNNKAVDRQRAMPRANVKLPLMNSTDNRTVPTLPSFDNLH